MGIDREKAIAALIEAIGESDLSAFGQQDHRPGEYRIDGWIDPASIFDAMLSAFAAQGFVIVPKDPTEAQWDGLARDIMMWLDMGDKTPRALFKHLERCGKPIPDWLRNEPEMKALDHVPSKGTRCVLLYKAMLAASQESSHDEG